MSSVDVCVDLCCSPSARYGSRPAAPIYISTNGEQSISVPLYKYLALTNFLIFAKRLDMLGELLF